MFHQQCSASSEKQPCYCLEGVQIPLYACLKNNIPESKLLLRK